jgi:sugar-specific transcriptional regulator TrmB
VSELAEPFDMALPSFLQHLKVLEDCGLVRSQKSGRIRTYQISPEPLRAAEGWMTEQRALWERRLDQLDRYLEDLKPGDEESRNKHDAMGFQTGWGKVLEQLVEHMKTVYL